MKTRTGRVPLSFAAVLIGLLYLPWAAHGQLHALGTCTGAGASLSFSSLDWNGGVVDADGNWSVSGTPDGVRLRYSIDGTLFQEEFHTGTSGSWTFSDNFDVPGYHTLSIEACPTAISGGVRTTCLAHCSTQQLGFTTRPEVSVGCNQVSTSTMICTGSLQVGTSSPYTCYWKEGNGSWYAVSCWEEYFTCKSYTPAYTVYFKVTDSNGKESNVALEGCNAILN